MNQRKSDLPSSPSAGVLLVTHGKLGHVLLDTLREMMPLPLVTDVLEVRHVTSHEVLLSQGKKMMERLDSGAGVLLLTDAYGATPSNIANKLGASQSMPVVSGVNLPMLVRIFNYPTLPLSALVQAAVEGGKRGVFHCAALHTD